MCFKNGYFLQMDLLGTKKMMRNLESKKFFEKINRFDGLVNDVANKHSVSNVCFISDTVFVTVDDDLGSLKRLIDFSRSMIEDGLAQSFPLRGSITYGLPKKYSANDLMIQNANRLEKMQDWIGVLVDIPTKHKFEDELVTYPIHSRSDDDPIRLYSAVRWKVPNYEQLVKFLTKDGLGGVPGEGEVLTWEFARKVTNTILFGIWVDCCKKGDKFCGSLPIEFIDLNMRRSKNK